MTLERERLNQDDELLLYPAKTGVPVFVKLPPDVAKALLEVPPGPKPNPRYFFWSGSGEKKSAGADWQRSFRKLFDTADLKRPDGTKKRCFPHMRRHMLQCGMCLLCCHTVSFCACFGPATVRL